MESIRIHGGKKQKWLYIGGFFICLQVFLFLLLQVFITYQKATLEKKYTFSDKGKLSKNLAHEMLTSDEYSQEMREMTTITQDQDPGAAIAKLKEEMNTNSKLLYGCHEVLHEVGHIAYKKYKDLSIAMQYRDEICVGGYIHGVIEEYFFTEKPDFSKMITLCANYPNNSFKRWQCFHGMGHGLMLYSSNNVPTSLKNCNLITRQDDQDACYTGTYMENFNADAVFHPSKYLQTKDPFELCAHDTKHPDECYNNAPFAFFNYYTNNSKGALEWCDEAPVFYRNACYNGVGGQITRRNFNAPQEVERQCMSSNSEKIAPCISGMAVWYLDHYNNVKETEVICSKLKIKEHIELCKKTIKNNTLSFGG